MNLLDHLSTADQATLARFVADLAVVEGSSLPDVDLHVLDGRVCETVTTYRWQQFGPLQRLVPVQLVINRPAAMPSRAARLAPISTHTNQGAVR